LNEDILSLLLQAESEYHSYIKQSVKDAENYVETSRKKQTDYRGELEREFAAFEESESELLEHRLLLQCERMERQAANLKEQMKARQQEKVEQISKHLKEEVLAALWQ
jgi:hypothetical protein